MHVASNCYHGRRMSLISLIRTAERGEHGVVCVWLWKIMGVRVCVWAWVGWGRERARWERKKLIKDFEETLGVYADQKAEREILTFRSQLPEQMSTRRCNLVLKIASVKNDISGPLGWQDGAQYAPLMAPLRWLLISEGLYLQRQYVQSAKYWVQVATTRQQ
jgi:hypothetical protein